MISKLNQGDKYEKMLMLCQALLQRLQQRLNVFGYMLKIMRFMDGEILTVKEGIEDIGGGILMIVKAMTLKMKAMQLVMNELKMTMFSIQMMEVCLIIGKVFFVGVIVKAMMIIIVM
jgi:hypothetical protein